MAATVSCHPAAATWWPHSQQRQSQITQQLENTLLLMQFYINKIRKTSLLMMRTYSTRWWPSVPGCSHGRTADSRALMCPRPPPPPVRPAYITNCCIGPCSSSMATDAMSGDQHPAEWSQDITCVLHLSLRCAVCCYC